MHAWSDESHPSSVSAPRPHRHSRHASRVALLVAATRTLHEHNAAKAQKEARSLRLHVAQALDIPASTVEAQFGDDQSLLTASIAWLTRVHLRRQRTLADLLATGDFSRWTHAALLQSRTSGPVFGCEIGWLARHPDILGVDRNLLEYAYRSWQWQLTTALDRLQRRGLVSLETDLQRLGATVVSLLQGAYMTACRTSDLVPIEATFEAAAHLITGPSAW